MGTEQEAIELPAGWQLKERVAEGAFAVIYEGVSPAGKPVAIKVPTSEHEQTIPRFEREIKLLRSLPQHENIAGYQGHGTLRDGRPFVAMELVDGLNLEHLLASGRRLEEPAAVQLMMQVCDALSVLHVLGLSHGDIKPANIMLTRGDHTAKLLDFGMVRDSRGLFKTMETKQYLPGREFVDELDIGLLTGTPEYVAPEQIDDAQAKSAKNIRRGPPADVFAVAVIFYRLLTGRRLWPFRPEAGTMDEYQVQARAYLEARRKLDTSGLEAPPEIDQSLWRVLSKALSADPEQRQQDATAMRHGLEAYRSDELFQQLSDTKAPFTISGMLRMGRHPSLIQHTDIISYGERKSGFWKGALVGLLVIGSAVGAYFLLT